MKKRLLILVDTLFDEHRILAETIAKGSRGKVEVVLGKIKDITIFVEGKNVETMIGGRDLKDFDLVFFRRIGSRNLHLAGSIIVYLDSCGIPFIDEGLRNTAVRGDKLTSLLKCAIRGLPVIPSYYCSFSEVDECLDGIIGRFGFPIVVKEIHQQYSKGVFVLRKKEDLGILKTVNIEGGRFIYQPFLKIESEYRILVLGGRVGSVQKMTRDLSGFKSRIDFEKIEEFVNPGKIDAVAKEIAVKASKVLGIQIAGVDVLRDENGSWKLIEVNRGPAFTYDKKISPELGVVSEYILRDLNNGKS